MQSSVLSQKCIKEFFDRPYRHARKSGHPEVLEIPEFRLAAMKA
jgi:hypothetical protein